jgi:hypothetical protein
MAEIISYQNDRHIVELLTSQPSPEAILAIRPTPALQARMSELLGSQQIQHPLHNRGN